MRSPLILNNEMDFHFKLYHKLYSDAGQSAMREGQSMSVFYRNGCALCSDLVNGFYGIFKHILIFTEFSRIFSFHGVLVVSINYKIQLCACA